MLKGITRVRFHPLEAMNACTEWIRALVVEISLSRTTRWTQTRCSWTHDGILTLCETVCQSTTGTFTPAGYSERPADLRFWIVGCNWRTSGRTCRQNTAGGSEPRTFTRWGAPSATVLTRLNNFKNTEIKQHCSFFVQSAGLTTSRCFAESAGFFPSRLLSLGNLRAINPTHSLVVSYQGWCGWALSPMDSGKARKQEQESQEGKKVCFHSTCTWCSFSDSDVSCVWCFANFKT